MFLVFLFSFFCLVSSIKMLILDEADEMLAQGFNEQIYDIYRYLPPGTQVSRSFGVGVRTRDRDTVYVRISLGLGLGLGLMLGLV